MFKCLEKKKKSKKLPLILLFSNFTIKLNGGAQGMFIKYRNPVELRETVIILQNRFKFQNLSEQVAVSVWEMNCSSV